MMTRRTIELRRAARNAVAAVFLALSAFLSASAGADLTTFAPSDGGFSVLLPGVPKMERTQDASSDMRLWKLTGSPFGFIIAVGDYTAHLQADAVLDYYMAKFLEGAGGTSQSQEHMRFGDAPDGPLPAIDFTFAMNTVQGESLVIVSGDRTYQIAVMYPHDYNGKDYVQRILSSFKITAPRRIWGGG
jgi:hypothetical protein